MRLRDSYPHIVSTLALVVALGGTGAYAAGLAKDSVTSRQIKNGAIKTVDLGAGSVTGAVVNESSLGKVPSAARVDGLQRIVTATLPADASHTALATRGTLKLDLLCDFAPNAAILRISTTADDASYVNGDFSRDDLDVEDGRRSLTYASDNTDNNVELVQFAARGADGSSMTVLGSVRGTAAGCSADLYILS